MYQVTEKYIEQMMKRGTRRRLTGTIGTVPFTGANVVRGSFSVSNRATEESNTKIGGVNVGEMNLTFLPSFLTQVARNEFKDKAVSISVGLWLPDVELPAGGEWFDVPMGVFTLQAPKISKQGIAVTGYDNMAKLDKSFNIDVASATPYGYLNYISENCGVEIGNTQAEIEALPNGTDILPMYTPNDIETYRDLLYWVAQSCGCFAMANRQGKIELRKFGTTTGISIDEMHRDIDVEFSGYTTKWTGVSFVNIETQMTNYYGLEIDDGLTMNMGSNPLLQIGSGDAIERRRRNVLNAVAQIQYTPFKMNSVRDPAFDLGDELPFTGGISGNCTGCIMAFEYELDNYSFEGYGDDPVLANAKSKNDKNISGLMQSTVENEITFYNFSNLEQITFGSEQEVSIAKLRFVAAQETTVKIMHEFIFDMLAALSSDGSYEVHYYLDDELVAYSPVERIGGIYGGLSGITEFSVCRDLFYVIKGIEPNINHTWEVKILAHGINSITIDENHAHITLEGQRMYSDEFFGGLVEASDVITVIPLGYLSLVSITETVDINSESSESRSISDNIGLYNVGTLQVISIAEGTGEHAPQIRLRGGAFINTEAGQRLCTEDGTRFITSR